MQQAYDLEPWAVVAYILEHAVLKTEKSGSCSFARCDAPASDVLSELQNRFNAHRPPLISIYDYLVRIKKFSNCSGSCYILALIYIDRVLQKNPELLLTRLNIHRLIITSLILSVKFLDDLYYSNEYYSRIGGIASSELNRLELAMLSLLKFDLSIAPETYYHYIDSLRSEFLQLVCQELLGSSEDHSDRQVFKEDAEFSRVYE